MGRSAKNDEDRLVLNGRFKLIRHLGAGGMAEVFLAEQRSLGRLVALKVLKRDLGKQPQMAERFRRQARLLSSVDHPNVVRVIDFESAREGTVLVLELAEGETLDRALKDGPFETKRALKVLTQLAEGLTAIHERGIVHRDLKPQNVVIAQTPRGEHARLLDFGIARLMEIPDEPGFATPPPIVDNPMLSQPGQAVGTPAYIAPEQATAQTIDARTDVYAFGVLAFRTLAGQLPFNGPSSREFLAQHAHAKPKELLELAPALRSTPKLAKLVMQCLEKKPDDRPRDAKALLEALRALGPVDETISTHTRRAVEALTTQTWNTVSQTAGTLGERSVASARFAARVAARMDPQFRRSLVIALLFALLPFGVWAAWPASETERVEAMLHAGQTQYALTLIDAALPTATGARPSLLALKAVALQRLGRADDERVLLTQSPYQVLFEAHPLVLASLAQELAGAETEPELGELIAIIPMSAAKPELVRLAGAAPSATQWGALRWLDVMRAENVSFAPLYATALGSKECRVRSVAAQRLGELGDLQAIEALRSVSEAPKSQGPTGVVNCGQDEAADAIRALHARAAGR